MYTKPIGDIVARYGMQYHCYADDTQIYLTVERDESIVAALNEVELCFVYFPQLDTPSTPGVFVFTMKWGRAYADLSLFV